MPNRLDGKGWALFLICSICSILLAGCSETTVTPLIRASDTLSKPDRLLVYDFEVTPAEGERDEGTEPRRSGNRSPIAQTDAEIQIGKRLAAAMTENLIRALRDRGINAYRAADALPPGEDTASVKGRFLHVDRVGRTVSGFRLDGDQVRTHIWMFQGTGLALRLVAEGEIATPSTLKQETDREHAAGGLEADARRIAAQVADRIVDYCKRRGWLD